MTESSALRWQVVVGGGVLVLVAVALHLNAGYTYPRPWPDESHFVTPAITLVRQGRLAVPELNAPSGIFWVPTGYYLTQVPALLLRIDPLAAARWLSLAGVLLFAGGTVAAARRAGVHAAVALAAVLAWSWMPRVVALGNIGRMEGVVLGIAGACLWLAARDRLPLALALALLAPLVHPVDTIVAVAVVAAVVVRGGRRRWTWVEKAALAAVAVLWAVEVAYFLRHAQVAGDHLRFQFTRKAGRPIVWRWWQVVQLTITAVAGVVATWRWRRGAAAMTGVWIALALAGGFVLVDVVGREMWYEALGRETVILLAGLAGLAALTRNRRYEALGERLQGGLAVGLTLVLLIAGGIAVRGALTGGWYGMRPNAASNAEWRAFRQLAVAELQQFDGAVQEQAVVVIDPLSGFGQEVTGRSFAHLQFVQPTPATPLDTLTADYVLATPGVPFVTKSLVEQWGPVEPALEVTSGAGAFTLQLFANPEGG